MEKSDVKETREALVRGGSINGQYVLGPELGRGSYGTVFRGEDSVRCVNVAIKVLDAKKLKRNRAMASGMLGGGLRPGLGFRGVARRPSPHPMSSEERERMREKEREVAKLREQEREKENPIDLVRGEIAIMKKLQHPNIVRLYEVLYDPKEDMIYMVYELLEKGVLMEVSLNSTANPLSEDDSRFYFRQLILAIEYLHEHDIAHRDIKPDNLLISNDNVLKIVDFGVSEIFQQGNDKTKKSEGSPAFFAPELCTPNHGEISAKAVDIWAMGVTLFCLVKGRLPFTGGSIVDLYEDVKNSNPQLNSPMFSASLTDLISRLLEKDASRRITMDNIRTHSWVTKENTLPLIPSKCENCHKLVTEITKEEMASAVSIFNPVWTVMRAIQKFRTALTPTGSRVGSRVASRSVSREDLSSVQGKSSSDDIVKEEQKKSTDSLEVPKNLY